MECYVFFPEVGCKAVFFVCNKHVAVFEDYNLSHHFQAKDVEKKSMER